jgi:hypothetical protein
MIRWPFVSRKEHEYWKQHYQTRSEVLDTALAMLVSNGLSKRYCKTIGEVRVYHWAKVRTAKTSKKAFDAFNKLEAFEKSVQAKTGETKKK